MEPVFAFNPGVYAAAFLAQQDAKELRAEVAKLRAEQAQAAIRAEENRLLDLWTREYEFKGLSPVDADIAARKKVAQLKADAERQARDQQARESRLVQEQQDRLVQERIRRADRLPRPLRVAYLQPVLFTVVAIVILLAGVIGVWQVLQSVNNTSRVNELVAQHEALNFASTARASGQEELLARARSIGADCSSPETFAEDGWVSTYCPGFELVWVEDWAKFYGNGGMVGDGLVLEGPNWTVREFARDRQFETLFESCSRRRGWTVELGAQYNGQRDGALHIEKDFAKIFPECQGVVRP